MAESPCKCEECTEDEWHQFGCGLHDLEGKGWQEWTNGIDDETISHSCPRWCASLPFVSSVLGDIGDYERGALGCVLDLEAPHLEYLRVAVAERVSWEAEMSRQMR